MRFGMVVAMCVLAAAEAGAAEIELRAQAQAQAAGGIVTLADVATIHPRAGENIEALAALELVPAPTLGRSRTLKSREVQDLLGLQGVRIVDHQFSGASSVQITSGSGGVGSTLPAQKATRSTRDQVLARVERAIARHLQQVADDRLAWSVAAELSEEQILQLAARGGDVVAEGGREPWTGKQQFALQLRTPQGIQRLAVDAIVNLPEMVVVARRPFRKGEVIQASDVTLQMPPNGEENVALATHLEDVIGRETVRSIATGQPLEPSWLRKPVLVRRGEVVTVFARGSGLVVRTQARAVEDGGKDDVIGVERLDNRQRFTARVTGVQELEVFVGGVRVTEKTER